MVIICTMQVNLGLQVFHALSDLARRYQFRNRDEMCCYGLTVSQCYALQALLRGGSMPSSELSNRLGLDLSSTTRLVDQLVRKKLATKRRSLIDARIREVAITEAGERMIFRLEEDFAVMIDHALETLPAEVRDSIPEVLRTLEAVLSGCSTQEQTVVPVERVRAIAR